MLIVIEDIRENTGVWSETCEGNSEMVVDTDDFLLVGSKIF
jgi:hypothetical protein